MFFALLYCMITADNIIAECISLHQIAIFSMRSIVCHLLFSCGQSGSLCITYVPNMELQDQSNLQEKKAFLTLYYNTNSLMNFLLQTAYVFYLESHKKRQIICMIKILTTFISFFYITVLHLYSFSLTYKTELNSD